MPFYEDMLPAAPSRQGVQHVEVAMLPRGRRQVEVARTSCTELLPCFSLRSWGSKDDEAGAEDARKRAHQVAENAALVEENFRMLHGLVNQDQIKIATIADLVNRSDMQVQEAVALLRRARCDARACGQWLLPVAGGVFVGVIVPIPAPIKLAIIAKSGIAGTGTILSRIGLSAVSRNSKVLADCMEQELGEKRVSRTLNDRACSRVVKYGDEMCARFNNAMSSDWRRSYISPMATFRGLTLCSRSSECRTGGLFCGSAYMITLEFSATPATVFEHLKQKQHCLSIDPDCQLSWEMQVHERVNNGTKEATALRSILFRRAFFCRNFFLVTRTFEDAANERYVLVSGTPPDEAVPKRFRKMSFRDAATQAHCQFMGVLVEGGIGRDRCRVHLALDVDPRIPVGGNCKADYVVRTRLIETAKRLRSDQARM